MNAQPEAILEANLVKQLSESLGYEKALIKDEEALIKAKKLLGLNNGY